MWPRTVVRLRHSVFRMDGFAVQTRMTGFHPEHPALFLRSGEIARTGDLRARKLLGKHHGCCSHLRFVQTAEVTERELGTADKGCEDVDRLKRIEHRRDRHDERCGQIIEWRRVEVRSFLWCEGHDGQGGRVVRWFQNSETHETGKISSLPPRTRALAGQRFCRLAFLSCKAFLGLDHSARSCHEYAFRQCIERPN